MVRYLRLLVALVVTMFAVPAMAFNPPPPPAIGSIVDQVGVLKPDAIRKLNQQLRVVNQNTTNQIGILIIDKPNGENMRDIGYATGKAWKVGQAGIDNGVMIVWARHDDNGGPGQVTIETGKGVEGDLPDLKCNDIIRNVIAPKFKDKYPGHFYDGLSQGIAAINGAIGDHRAALAAQRDKENSLRQNTPTPDNGGPPVAAGGPQTSSHSSSGCDVSGAPMQQAGLGGALFWVVLLLAGVWAFRRWSAKMAEQSRKEELRQQQLREQEARIEAEHQRAENERLAALNATLQAERAAQEARDQKLAGARALAARLEAERQARDAALRAQPTPIVVPIPVVHHDPLAVATAVTATAVVADRIRQEREAEERHQAELAAERREREQRELEERRLEARRADLARQAARDEEVRRERLARLDQERADRQVAEEAAIAAAAIAAAAVIVSSGDDDNSGGSSGSACSSSPSSCSSGSSCSSSSNDSSSCSSSSGGGDIGGGGSDGGACSS